MTTIFLPIHLIGAIATLILIFLGSIALFKNYTEKFSFYSKAIGFLGAYDIISGSLLTLASSNQSALVFCSRVALYVSIIALIETIFFFKMKGVEIFPKKALAYSSAVSFGFAVSTLFLI